MSALPVEPRLTATAEVRRASSSCCGAKLAGAPDEWECRECWQPCGRVLGEPEEVVLNG